MTYQKKVINPISGTRLRWEIEQKFGTRKIAYFAKMVGLEPVTLSYICSGKRALTNDRAEQFGKILGVRAEYLLGLDDCRTYDKTWLTESIKIDEKKEIFFKHCLSFWGYEIIGIGITGDVVSEGIIENDGLIYRIRKPSGEIIEIDDIKESQIRDEILNFVKYKLDTGL